MNSVLSLSSLGKKQVRLLWMWSETKVQAEIFTAKTWPLNINFVRLKHCMAWAVNKKKWKRVHYKQSMVYSELRETLA